MLGLVYFGLGQGMGGILTGSATDPGTGPLLVLLAVCLPAYKAERRDRDTPVRVSQCAGVP